MALSSMDQLIIAAVVRVKYISVMDNDYSFSYLEKINRMLGDGLRLPKLVRL
jgi:hypothetical protein